MVNLHDSQDNDKSIPPRLEPPSDVSVSFLKWLSRTSEYVRTHGPEVAERTWLGGLSAYRRGSKALQTNALSASGVDIKSAAISLICTMLILLLSNLLVTFWIATAYSRYSPDFAPGTKSIATLEQAFERKGWTTSQANAGDLHKIVALENLALPLHRWVEIGFLEVSSDKQSREPASELRHFASGSPRGWFFVERDIPTGGAVYSKLLDSPRSNRTLKNGIDESPECKALCVGMIDELVTSVQLPIRLQKGLNGSIQFATIFVGLFVLTAVVRRYLFVAKIAGNWLGSNFNRTVLQHSGKVEDRELRLLVQRLASSKDVDAECLYGQKSTD